MNTDQLIDRYWRAIVATTQKRRTINDDAILLALNLAVTGGLTPARRSCHDRGHHRQPDAAERGPAPGGGGPGADGADRRMAGEMSRPCTTANTAGTARDPEAVRRHATTDRRTAAGGSPRWTQTMRT